MRNTIAPRTALGMSVSTAVKNIATSSTIADMVRLASWVRPLCSSRIWVLVGLPLTTKVPDRPAAKLAAESPTMSRFTSALWPCFMAKLREVAALCAMIRMKQENAITVHVAQLFRSMPLGRPIGGKPPCTAPTTATPRVDAPVNADTPINNTTAMIAPGTLGARRLKPTMMTKVAVANANVAQLRSPSDAIRCHCWLSQEPDPLGIPSMSGIWPVNTCTPTPVRKPMRTDAERKSPRKPSRNTLAMSNRTPQIKAMKLVYASHSAEFGVTPAMAAAPSPAARIAAVAESAPTTSNRDAPSRANMTVGKITVYRPVTTGVWAMEVYPMVSGIATAASVAPATTSGTSHARR